MDIQNCSSQTCLANLVSLRSSCITGNCTPYFIEDLEGVDIEFLANTASTSNISAEEYAKQLIDTAARLMLADIQMLMTSGYSLVEAFGESCSTCVYLNTFQAGGGVVVRNVVGSKLSVLKITKIEINCNATGLQMLVIDDGKAIKKYPFVAGGMNVITPVLLAYETSENIVKVYLEDSTIKTATISCNKKSGCGCSGGDRTDGNNSINYTGLLMGMFTTQQYGFKVCSSVVCSSDVLVCQMVKQTPNLFGATLLYKVGQLLYSNAGLTTRNNRVTVDEEEQKDMAAYYESLYKQRLNGTSTVKGLKLVTTGYLSRNIDQCVVCDSVYKIAYATG